MSRANNQVSVATKKYTIASLIREISALRVQVSNSRQLAMAISPRTGIASAKFRVLNGLLNNRLNSVISGAGSYAYLGATPKARVVRALRNRKSNGAFGAGSRASSF